jgi:hypothetical protein
VIDAMSEQSEVPARTFGDTPSAVTRDRERAPMRARSVGLALVMIAFTAIGIFAYSVYASGVESAASGQARGGASTLVRASTLTAESASLPATTIEPLPVEPARVMPDAAPRADRAVAREGARIGNTGGPVVKSGIKTRVKAQAPRGNPPPEGRKLRYWRAPAAEPDVGF